MGYDRRTALSTAAAVMGSLAAGCTTLRSEMDGNDTDVTTIAHRGCADQYPENTVRAVERSAPHVDAIEIDVQRCGSGEIVVFHDERLDRLTDERGRVAQTPWETLRQLQIRGTDARIPRLSTLLAAVPTDTDVNVELKHGGMVEDVLEIASDVDNELLYSSFRPTALQELRTVDETVPLALVVPEGADRPVQRATELDCVALHPNEGDARDPAFVDRAHEAGLRVNVWTVDDAATATELVEAGVDGLIVNRWDVIDDAGN